MSDLDIVLERGMKKIETANKNSMLFLWKSIMAGFFLGAAMIISYTLGALFSADPAISKMGIAFTFGIGLVCIVFLNAELFTGNCLLTMLPVYHKQIPFHKILKSWVICYVGNAIGIGLIGILFILSQKNGTLFENYLQPACESKLTFTVLSLLWKAILCNFIVCIASYASIKVKSDGAKTFVIMILVAAFVIAGLEHCVANWGFFSMVFAQYGLQFDWTAFPLHMLIATIGNILGGGVLLGYPLYQMLKREKEC